MNEDENSSVESSDSTSQSDQNSLDRKKKLGNAKYYQSCLLNSDEEKEITEGSFLLP